MSVTSSIRLRVKAVRVVPQLYITDNSDIQDFSPCSDYCTLSCTLSFMSQQDMGADFHLTV